MMPCNCRLFQEKPIEVSDRPHLVGEDETLFLHELGRAVRYLEYGAGGSTVAAARRGIETVCIESDRRYAAAVRTKIGSMPHRVVLHYADIGRTGRWGRPLKVFATPGVRRRYPAYVYAPDQYVNSGFFDLVLIDGRFRVACALYAVRRVVESEIQSTICFDDYMRRPEYHAVEEFCTPEEVGEQMAIFRPHRHGLVRLPEDSDIRGCCKRAM